MFWWSIIARACRSASKRAMTWRLSMPGLMILSATRRRTGSLLLGHVDDAHAALADLLEELVRPDAVAGPLAGRLVRPGEAVGAALEDAGGPVVGLEQPLDCAGAGPHPRRTPRPGTPAARPRGPCRARRRRSIRHSSHQTSTEHGP